MKHIAKKVWVDKHFKLSKGQILGLIVGLLFLVGLGIALIYPIESTLHALGW